MPAPPSNAPTAAPASGAATTKPCDEPHGSETEQVGGGRKRLPVQHERSIGMPHNDRYVREEEVMLAPREPGDLLLDLPGARGLVVANGPEMADAARSLISNHWPLPHHAVA